MHTKVFNSGNSQAVRLPKEFRFDVSEVEIFRRNDEIVLRKPATNLSEALEQVPVMPEEFFEDERHDPPPEKRESL